ncbi:uncharacterized protein si:ch211-286b4.4 [Poeciliopsis prolifica]|uniref:uncharacterized protein si:ch211-286b4.4 n=1 Tax=Poeciliopsis prolifica TaxID=188132 RepID=UPI002413C5A4|nr:uncharacterized protein si:ch211-286b4.4 [Poeciliopsis prolifica]
MGICRCERYVSAEEICNTSCLFRLPQLSAELMQNGDLQLSVRERNSRVWARKIENVLGPDIHAQTSGRVHLVQFTSEGLFGWIPLQKDLVNLFLSEPINIDINKSSRKRRNTEDDENKADALPRIPNPIACLSLGDMLVFHLTINHTARPLSHFPVYQKDHLFNSNPSWDFGAFRHLQILMKQTQFNSSMFAHVFSEAGKYVFVDSVVPEWSIVVVVSGEGTECDTRAAAFQPMTPGHLVKYGIVKNHRLNLLPDWGLIVGILSLLLVLVVVLTTTVLVLRPSKAKLVPHWKIRPKWRSLGEPFCPAECVCSRESITVQSQGGVLASRGEGEGAEAEESAVIKGGSVSGCLDLEEFNVKTLYDKLEDQNLHIAAQLARHRKDMQEFYRNICQQAESLKDVFENMDSKNLSLLKKILVHNVRKDVLSHTHIGEGDNQDISTSQAEASVSLLGAVLRSVEGLLCKLTAEAWQNQDLRGLPYCHGSRESEAQVVYMQPGNTNMCFTQSSSMSMNKGEAIYHETGCAQTAAPCFSEDNLSKLVTVSPLFKTLQEIQQSLQQLTADESHKHSHEETGPSFQENHKGRLIPTALDSLSPQYSAVYLFGCHVVQWLADSSMFPSVLLLLAKSIPFCSSSSNENPLAHFTGDFYFDSTNQILYLSEAKLQHVGHFIAVILLSMAHIAVGSKPQRFLQALHEAISAVSLQLFNLSFKWSPAEPNFDALGGRHGALVEQFLNIRVPSEARFTEPLLARRLEKYKYFKLEDLICNLKQRSTPNTGLPPNGTPVQMSCVEEEIDRMSESFLQLSMQMQRRSQISSKESENGASEKARETSASTPSLSRNGTILLELKRCYVSQRLNELQTTLNQMRRCQLRDDEPRDGTKGSEESDDGSDQHREKEHDPATDCRGPPDHLRSAALSAGQKLSPRSPESSGLLNDKAESYISDQLCSDQES